MRSRIIFLNMMIALGAIFFVSSVANAQIFFGDPYPTCTLGPGDRQLSIAGDGSRTCGSQDQASIVKVTDALGVDACDNIPAAQNGGSFGTFPILLIWNATLNGGNGEWSCLPTSDNVNNASLPVEDTIAIVAKSGDTTARLRFNLSGIATNNTRVLAIPDTDVDLGDIATNAGAIATEILRAGNAETVNADAIAAEILRAGNAETVNADAIGINATNISNAAGITGTNASNIGTNADNIATNTSALTTVNTNAQTICVATDSVLDAEGDCVSLAGGFTPDTDPAINHTGFNTAADARIAAAAKTGLDVALVTGTKGLPTHCAQWNTDGDLVTAGAPCGTSSSGGHTIQQDGNAIAGQPSTDLNFTGAGVSCSDVMGVTTCDFTAQAPGAEALRVYDINNPPAGALLNDNITDVMAPPKVTQTTAGPRNPLRENAAPLINIGIQYACENGYDIAYLSEGSYRVGNPVRLNLNPHGTVGTYPLDNGVCTGGGANDGNACTVPNQTTDCPSGACTGFTRLDDPAYAGPATNSDTSFFSGVRIVADTCPRGIKFYGAGTEKTILLANASGGQNLITITDINDSADPEGVAIRVGVNSHKNNTEAIVDTFVHGTGTLLDPPTFTTTNLVAGAPAQFSETHLKNEDRVHIRNCAGLVEVNEREFEVFACNGQGAPATPTTECSLRQTDGRAVDVTGWGTFVNTQSDSKCIITKLYENFDTEIAYMTLHDDDVFLHSGVNCVDDTTIQGYFDSGTGAHVAGATPLGVCGWGVQEETHGIGSYASGSRMNIHHVSIENMGDEGIDISAPEAHHWVHDMQILDAQHGGIVVSLGASTVLERLKIWRTHSFANSSSKYGTTDTNTHLLDVGGVTSPHINGLLDGLGNLTTETPLECAGGANAGNACTIANQTTDCPSSTCNSGATIGVGPGESEPPYYTGGCWEVGVSGKNGRARNTVAKDIDCGGEIGTGWSLHTGLQGGGGFDDPNPLGQYIENVQVIGGSYQMNPQARHCAVGTSGNCDSFSMRADFGANPISDVTVSGGVYSGPASITVELGGHITIDNNKFRPMPGARKDQSNAIFAQSPNLVISNNDIAGYAKSGIGYDGYTTGDGTTGTITTRIEGNILADIGSEDTDVCNTDRVSPATAGSCHPTAETGFYISKAGLNVPDPAENDPAYLDIIGNTLLVGPTYQGRRVMNFPGGTGNPNGRGATDAPFRETTLTDNQIIVDGDLNIGTIFTGINNGNSTTYAPLVDGVIRLVSHNITLRNNTIRSPGTLIQALFANNIILDGNILEGYAGNANNLRAVDFRQGAPFWMLNNVVKNFINNNVNHAGQGVLIWNDGILSAESRVSLLPDDGDTLTPRLDDTATAFCKNCRDMTGYTIDGNTFSNTRNPIQLGRPLALPAGPGLAGQMSNFTVTNNNISMIDDRAAQGNFGGVAATSSMGITVEDLVNGLVSGNTILGTTNTGDSGIYESVGTTNKFDVIDNFYSGNGEFIIGNSAVLGAPFVSTECVVTGAVNGLSGATGVNSVCGNNKEW
jgi:hypothetical protein